MNEDVETSNMKNDQTMKLKIGKPCSEKTQIVVDKVFLSPYSTTENALILKT